MDLKEGNRFESKVKTFSCNLGEKLRRIVVMFSVYCIQKTPEGFDYYTQNVQYLEENSPVSMFGNQDVAS